MSGAVLSVRGLRTGFPGPAGITPVVDGIDFDLAPGEVLALVGESGCGKTLTALSLLRLVPKPGRIVAGEIRFEGRELLGLGVSEMRRLRGAGIAMIFQEPMSCLNPVQRVGAQVVEAIRLHEKLSAAAARAHCIEWFERVRIPAAVQRFDSYPHELSGGLRQRVMIAMALAMRPRVLVADEPTTALDVTIQAQILDLLRELQADLGTAVLLITHDLGVVNEIADRIAVMYAGRIVEQAPRGALLTSPLHPYAQGLLRAIPARVAHGARLAEIPGSVPRPGAWGPGCRFASRCARVATRCREFDPPESAPAPQRSVACHFAAPEAP